MKPNRLISVAELVRRVGCSKAWVYRVFATGGELHHTLVDKKVDLDDPDVKSFCGLHDYKEPDGVSVVAAARKKPRAKRKAKPSEQLAVEPPTPENSIDVESADDATATELLEMPLGQVVARYGTAGALKEYVQVIKALVQTRGYEEEQERKRDMFIHRVHAEQLIVYVDTLQKTLLSDAVKNMATRAITQAKAGTPKRDIEKAMREVITRTIKSGKAEMVRRLRDV
jgi:methionine aminopeptidase